MESFSQDEQSWDEHANTSMMIAKHSYSKSKQAPYELNLVSNHFQLSIPSDSNFYLWLIDSSGTQPELQNHQIGGIFRENKKLIREKLGFSFRIGSRVYCLSVPKPQTDRIHLTGSGNLSLVLISQNLQINLEELLAFPEVPTKLGILLNQSIKEKMGAVGIVASESPTRYSLPTTIHLGSNKPYILRLGFHVPVHLTRK